MTTATREALSRRVRRNGLALLPAPIVAGAVLLLTVGAPPLAPLALGAAGWVVALIPRQPVALLAMRRVGKERIGPVVGWFSGPAEELVRLALVALVIRSQPQAVWAGFGWAAVEAVMIAVNTLLISTLIQKDDPKAQEARSMMEAQGMFRPVHPALGFAERLSATALHIGFTLLLLASPWFVLLTIPAHSITNMGAVRLAKSNLRMTEVLLAAEGVLALVVGAVLSSR